MPWDDSDPGRLVPFHHPTALLAVSLSFSQLFWTGSALSPCTHITHSPDCCRSYQWHPLPKVLGEARGFPRLLGPQNQLAKPTTLQRVEHKLLCPKATLVTIPKTLESNHPWLAVGHARLCPPLPALSTNIGGFFFFFFESCLCGIPHPRMERFQFLCC